ncbi:hypothetical protein BaRGS_00028791, partial [Batillaria attramentaria]
TSHGRHHVAHKQETKTGADDTLWALLAGDVTLACPPSDKIVRIFLSSTFTDTRHERNELMKEVFPRLRSWCQGQGYQFQVVDMRWGVRDEATDDHRTTDLCLREIERCTQISTGPCFVTLVSHKYGYRVFPREIVATEFDLLMNAISSEPAKELLKKWFRLDGNAVPPTYILQPISSQYPDFLSNEEAARKQAANQWWRDNEIMHEALSQAAVACLSKERAHALKESVTETEIRHGLLASKNLLERGLWFYRHIDHMDDVTPGQLSSRFKDFKGSETQNKESRELLENLKKEMEDKLPPDKILTYDVIWNKERGIDPETDKSHRDYISRLCTDFEKKLMGEIETAIKTRDQGLHVNPLLEEVTQHTRFAQEKCSSFYGRQNALERVREYLKGMSQCVHVIHGKSGSGKTSIVAMAAREALAIQHHKGGVILRFLGTTPDSTTVSSLLSSIICQLTAVKNRDMTFSEEDIPASMKERTDMFHELLEETASADFPVTLLLDSLDQLDPADNARQLTWLPTELPAHVKVIVSTLPEEQYEAFPKLQAIYEGKKSSFYEVPTLGDSDVSGILDQWLAASKRQLTPGQRSLVLSAFKQCPLPLFLKLSFDTACRWRSFMSPSDTVLQATVRDSINVMFSELETMHGKTFVSRALGYLTVSRGGLTETELEDVLSCDDDVLNDVYTYWTPPVRRLPPLLLVRLKADLGQYLVDRGADGVRVFFWYHRQFIEAAEQRYCNDLDTRLALHTSLSHFFAGTWANGNPKPYTDKSGKAGQANRNVGQQPLKFDHSFNLRKLNNLPFHSGLAQQREMLKKDCLLNFAFLQTKLQACGVRALLDDFSAARKAFPRDEDLKMVAETLQLSQDALQYDPKQLPSQILCRIVSPRKSLEAFLQQCRNCDDVYLMPNKQLLTPPGGQLVHSLAEHTGDVTGLAMTSDGKFVITCSEDRSICVIDVVEGKRVRKMEKVGRDPAHVHLCCNDSIIVTDPDDYIVAYTLNTGVLAWKVESETTRPQICFCGPGRSVMVLLEGQDISLYSAKTGQKFAAIDVPGGFKKDFDGYEPATGSERYAVATCGSQEVVVVVDVVEKKFVTKRRMRRDIRVHDDSDFSVEGLAISGDEKYVICANADDNDVHFLDIRTLETVKIYKGKQADFSEKFRVTPDGLHLYHPNRRAVRVWDLQKAQSASCLLHNNSITEVVTVDMRTFVTIADDRLIRIWDISRGLSEGKTTALEFRDAVVVAEGEKETTAAGGKKDEGVEEDEQAKNKNKKKIR